jgi:hypothetical protein
VHTSEQRASACAFEQLRVSKLTISSLAGSPSIADWASLQSCEYRHESGRSIRAIYPNALGTRAVVVDDAYAAVLFSPVDTRALAIPTLPDTVSKVLWDQTDRCVFLACNSKEAACYLYTPTCMTGPSVTQLGSLEVQANGDMIVEPVSSALPNGFFPVSLADGVVTGYTQVLAEARRCSA